MERYTGEVLWFNNKKGFGFIKRDDGQDDEFVHWVNINYEVNGYKTLEQGQKVSFSIGYNKKGQQAIDVDVLTEVE